jgi:hypothetical protein
MLCPFKFYVSEITALSGCNALRKKKKEIYVSRRAVFPTRKKIKQQ